MDEKEIIQNLLDFLNEIGAANKFDEYMKDKGYTVEEIEEIWDINF